MNSPLIPWFEREDGLLHPTSPLAGGYGPQLPLPGRFVVEERGREVWVRYNVKAPMPSFELTLHHGRLMLSGTYEGGTFVHSITLPTDLDPSRYRTVVAATELFLVFERYPVGFWLRTWRSFSNWWRAFILWFSGS